MTHPTSNSESPPAPDEDLRRAIETFELSEAVRAEIAKYAPTQPSFELLMTQLP